MIEFTHAIYDDEDNIIRKLRMSKSEYDWYQKEKPYLDIRKLDTKPKKNLQQELFNLVGECLL